MKPTHKPICWWHPTIMILLGLLIRPGYSEATKPEWDVDQLYQKRLEQTQTHYKNRTNHIRQMMELALWQNHESVQKQISRLWQSTMPSLPKQWRHFSHNKRTRSEVDFEKGTVTVEILLSEAEAMDSQEATQQFKEELSFLTNRARLSELLQIPDSELDESLTSPMVEETSQDGNISTYRVTFQLPSDHLQRRAERYSDIVLRESKKADLPPELVFSVIETESAFSPVAVSSAGAIGLMQLVPSSGGKEAYEALTGRSESPPRELLMNPTWNIQLGVKYLEILRDVYFPEVTDPQKQQLLMIAAYNTGPSNVRRGLDTHDPNQMSYSDLYHQLREHLPYAETRDYLKKVVQRIKHYKVVPA